MHLLLVLPVRADPIVEGELVASLVERGHRVDRAHGDDEALWLAVDSGFDVLVIDRDGGDADIPTLCSSLRGAGVWTPILLLTPVSDDQCVAALDAGADDYATEPATEPELDARLRALVRRGQPARPSVLVVGSVQLDPGSRRVRAQGQELSITGADRVPGGAHDLLGSGMPLSGPEQIEFGGGLNRPPTSAAPRAAASETMRVSTAAAWVEVSESLSTYGIRQVEPACVARALLVVARGP
jgi:CheY-like chemotaxis protein